MSRTIALNFSADLDNAFAINTPELAGLQESVEQKKQAVSTQNQQLQELQARIRETEERLKKSSSSAIGGKNTTVAERGTRTSLE